MRAIRSRCIPRSVRRSTLPLFVVVPLLGALGGCPEPREEEDEPPAGDDPAGEDPAAEVQATQARAVMTTADEGEAGVLVLQEEGDGVRIQGDLEVPAASGGDRGFHVHEVGECEAPDFASAGEHFDPHDSPHGGPDDPPDERHTGDLGNVSVDDGGMANVDVSDDVITLAEGSDGVGGRALVLHEEEDDLQSQPSGDAGDRAACGVIERDREAASPPDATQDAP